MTKRKKAALAKVSEDNAIDLADAEQLRHSIRAFADENRNLLAAGKNYITGNSGTVKWTTTKTWVIDVGAAQLLSLIRRLRAVRLVVTVVSTVSKEKLNLHPWLYPRLEKWGAAHLQQTTSFSIAPTGFISDPKKNPNSFIISSERIHEE